MSDIKSRIQTILDNPGVQNNASMKAFIQSLLDYYNRNNKLTEKQMFHLEKNEQRLKSWSPNNLTAETKWQQQYAKKKDILLKVAQYYKDMHLQGKSYYFERVCENALNDPNFIPSEEIFDRIVTNNKYARRFLTNELSEAKFEEGSLVTLSSLGISKHDVFTKFGCTEADYGTKNIGSAIVISNKKNVYKGIVVSILVSRTGEVMEVPENLLKNFRDQ